jgi:hypothetical protein
MAKKILILVGELVEDYEVIDFLIWFTIRKSTSSLGPFKALQRTCHHDDYPPRNFSKSSPSAFSM